MSVKILVAGDFCPQNRVAEKFEHGDYQFVLGDVKDVLSEVDYSIVNFECPVVRGDEQPIPKQGPNLKCSENGIEGLKWAGFNCVTLANNHFLDYGKEGVSNTLEVCRKYGLDTVGGGLDLTEASKILYKDIKGKRIAIINCCEHEFSIATNNTAGSNPLNPIKQYYAILEAKKQVNYVLVIVHGGHEHFQLPSPRMQEAYRFFIDAGADAVVNHHQHCFSGYEMYKGKPIFYGLGNFCFDNPNTCNGLWTEGIMTELEFDSEKVGFTIYPYHQCASEPNILFGDDSLYRKRIEELNGIIANETALKNEVNKYYDHCANLYSDAFEPVRMRYYLGAKHRGWLPSFITKKNKLIISNKVCCESHRDILVRWFED